jgi:7,8-dihydropterin-6-yl-methyl-4-(beta-D-ribofuranosyl)aminobenzene 5'-phosphate synthase
MLELDELHLVVVTDNETDSLSSIDNDVQANERVALLDRLEPSYVIDGKDHISVLDHMCCASHGFSVLATGLKDGISRTVLFDVGPYGDIWLANAARLDIHLAAIETVFLSHWHWDHSGGLVAVISAIAGARSEAGLPAPVLEVHPSRPDHRGTRLSDGRVALLPEDPTFDQLAAAGATVMLSDVDHEIADGFFHGSGEIPRITAFETGLSGHETRRNGTFESDPLILDERYFAANVKGRGTTILSACSHAGVINVATAATQLHGLPLDLVLGGYHLAGKVMEGRIFDTVAALKTLDPRLVGPGHCTGWRAKAALAAAFSPSGQYAPSSVGTQYHLRA